MAASEDLQIFLLVAEEIYSECVSDLSHSRTRRRKTRHIRKI